MSQQNGGSFQPYKTSTGTTIDLLYPGIQSAQEILETEQQQNVALTSLLRGLGILLMFAGLRMLFGPIELLTSRILLVGTLFSFGASFIAAAISIPLSLIAISLGWLLYRPLIGILLLFLAGSIIFGAMMLLFAASKLRSKPA